MAKTKPSVFIIESMRFKDEKNGDLEGLVLQQILHLSGKKAEYVYIRTAQELEEVLDQFYDSNYRYLHISCHGNPQRNGADAGHTGLLQIRDDGPAYTKRTEELFVSACAVVNKEFAKAVIPDSECQSIVGPSETISFADAAMMWAAFYHLVFKDESRRDEHGSDPLRTGEDS